MYDFLEHCTSFIYDTYNRIRVMLPLLDVKTQVTVLNSAYLYGKAHENVTAVDELGCLSFNEIRWDIAQNKSDSAINCEKHHKLCCRIVFLLH